MKKTMKGCVQLFLKLVNSIMGIAGISMILYSAWMVRVWQRDMEGSSSDFHSYSIPWFIHAFLGIGITLCAITCLGHVAAKTANAHCLSAYMVTLFLLLLVETALISDIILNSDWKKDLPEDPTGRLDDFKDFVKSNLDTCKCIGLLIVLAQKENPSESRGRGIFPNFMVHVRDMVQKGEIQLEFVNTKEQLADIMIKSVAAENSLGFMKS